MLGPVRSVVSMVNPSFVMAMPPQRALFVGVLDRHKIVPVEFIRTSQIVDRRAE